VLTKTIFKAQG